MTPKEMRNEITDAYTITAYGTIADPGKFEGQMIYVPYLWESSLEGGSDENFGNIQFFIIQEEDRQAFPELGLFYGLALVELDNGFVISREYTTKEEYDKAVEELEQQEIDEDTEDLMA